METGSLCYYFPSRGPRGVAWIGRLLKKKSNKVTVKLLADPFGKIISKRARTVNEKRIWPITHQETLDRYKNLPVEENKKKEKWKFDQKQ